jgi:hypothetical protein
MRISAELKQRLQLVMMVAILVSGTRLVYILYERHQSNVDLAKKQPSALNPDYYVSPKKLYPFDLTSARQLTDQPVWVKVGYAQTCFLYDPVRHRVDFSREARKLLPIEKLLIKDVITANSPDAPGEPQVMAVFENEAKAYAFSIGSIKNGEYKFYSDDMLFIQDPHELYKHWPPDVWEAIDKRQVKAGMSELQASFAVGLGIPDKSGEPGDRTVNYPNGGNPLRVTYQNDKATAIHSGSAP